MPSIGEIAPPSTWYLPGTPGCVRSRRRPWAPRRRRSPRRRGADPCRYRHRTSAATLPQTSQNRTSSFTRCNARLQPGQVDRVGGQQVKGDALRGLRADARQPAELVDEVLDGAFVHGGSGLAAAGGRAAGRQLAAAGRPARRRGGRRRRSPRRWHVGVVDSPRRRRPRRRRRHRHRLRRHRRRRSSSTAPGRRTRESPSPAGPHRRTGRSPPATDPMALLASCLGRPAGVVHRGDDQVLEGLHVGGVDHRRVDADARSSSPPPLTTAVTSPPPAEPVTSVSRQRGLGAFHLGLHLLRLQQDLGQVGHTGHHQQIPRLLGAAGAARASASPPQ